MATLHTPGVYINELNAFSNSVVPVATAVPAFIGYTARADYHGKSYAGVPVRLESFAQYRAFFGAMPASGQSCDERAQSAPVYFPVPAAHPPEADVTIDGKGYDLRPDASSIYYFYRSLQLFYANGGGTCYVVSVGTFGPDAGKPLPAGAPLVNPNVKLQSLLAGLAALEREEEPTMIVVPDATLLSAADNQTLNRAILAQCGRLKSRMGLFDVLGAATPSPNAWQNDLANFRHAVGEDNLSYGAAYYPFLKTTVVPDAAADFRAVGGGKILASILPGAAVDPLKTLLAGMDEPAGSIRLTAAQIETALRATSPAYLQLHQTVLAKMNVLPPSGAMAGVYTTTDATRGVWSAPANLNVLATLDVTLRLTDTMQAGLNVDAASGKSINAIRLFPGRGVIVWGARTLDGNSQDWRYVNVRRTLIMLEQSMKLAMQAYVFEPNTANTWVSVRSTLENFLATLWKAGALAGATPAAAFSVAVGLGSTMTGEDILDGVMRVSVKIAMTHPAEFIVITFQQKMQTP